MNYFAIPHDYIDLKEIDKRVSSYFRLNTVREKYRGRKKQFERQMFLYLVFTLQKEYPRHLKKLSQYKIAKYLRQDHTSIVYHKKCFLKGSHIDDWSILNDNYVTNHFFNLLSLFTGIEYFDRTKQFTYHNISEMDFELMEKIWAGGECYITIDDYCDIVEKRKGTVEKYIREHKLKSRKFKKNGKLKTYVKIK